MLDAFLDALIDSAKIIPFLFLTYLLMEYLEEKIEEKSKQKLKKAGHAGPIWGALIGAIPQCGFSAGAASLYAGRVISVGTLIAVFLSTSDEMLPILITAAVSPVVILKILGMKVIIGMVAGILVDFIYVHVLKRKEQEVDIHHFCEHEHCSCGQGILKPAIKHTLQIAAFIFVISFLLNYIVAIIGLERISESVLNKPIIGEMLAGLIGLIPNCGASVAITSLYLNGVMNYGTMMAGLLVSAGVGVMVLIKVNEDRKQNAVVIALMYGIGVLAGMIINLLGIVV
ncbi:MAG: arsenic efflux protein [Lachnospiraceae bacterium]|nr:arsenic efflux protein [Candidatus Colinaster scatohippi]